MIIKNHLDFLKAILKQIDYKPFSEDNRICWKNTNAPESGFLHLYERPGCYLLSVADYTVPHDFSLAFHNSKELLRFGSFYMGKTHFQIEGIEARSSSPASFLVKETELKGMQEWHSGQRFCGIEFSIYTEYLHSLKLIDKSTIQMDAFKSNFTYCTLPPQILAILRELMQLSCKNSLTPLFIESRLLECIFLLSKAVSNGEFSMPSSATARLGNRHIHFNSFDIQAIHAAHTILSEQLVDTPTIAQLSKMVFLNEQKLKAGFSLCYGMTIGTYINECRMSTAAHLLITTHLSIHDIAIRVGYKSPSSFTHCFRDFFHKTPRQFRQAYEQNGKKLL